MANADLSVDFQDELQIRSNYRHDERFGYNVAAFLLAGYYLFKF